MTLTPAGYRPRYIDSRIDLMLEAFGAVCVEGPKHCGKTWSSLNRAESCMMVADPSGDFENRRLVSADVGRALSGGTPHLVDEWQEVPGIWDAVRAEVDRSPDNGRFILTGSSTPVRRGVVHSGAGRIGRMGMRTMSLYESGDSDGSVSLTDLFDGRPMPDVRREVGLEHLIDLTVRGGWPRNIGRRTEAAMLNNRGYVQACIEDVGRMDGRARDTAKIGMVLRSLARNECTTASNSKVASDVSEGTVSDKAVSYYLDVFGRLFLTSDQPPFDPGYRSSVRVGRGAKRHLADPSLAVAALGLTPEKLLGDLRTFGFLFESMCERDLDVYAGSVGGSLHHYRDAAGREIDAVVELPDGRWGAFEVKLGMDQVDRAADGLLDLDSYMSERGARRPSVMCVVCGLAKSPYRRSDGVYVVPITSLRGGSLGV